MLADEPTAALDSKSGRDVIDIMQKLAKESNCTILLVTHDNRILDIADRIVNLEDVRLTNAGTVKADSQEIILLYIHFWLNINAGTRQFVSTRTTLGFTLALYSI